MKPVISLAKNTYGRSTRLVRNAYGGLSKEIWLLALAQFINRAGTMVIFFLAVYLTKGIGLSDQRYGIVAACFGAGAFTGVYLGGRLVDRIGPHRVMKWSLLIGGALFFVVVQLREFYSLCIGMFVLSAVADAFRPANMASIFYYSTPDNYTRSVSLNRLGMNLGFSFGPALGGVLADHYGHQSIFWADGISSMFAAVLVIFLIGDRFVPRSRSEKAAAAPPASAFKDRLYMLFLPLSVLYAMTFFQFFSTMPLYYSDHEHLSSTQIGLLLALNGIIVAGVEMVLIYKLEKRTSMFNFIAIGSVLLVFSYIALIFFHGMAWMVVITVVISFSEMLAMPFMNAFMNARSTTDNKGQYASLYGMSWSAGQILIPLVATNMIAWLNYPALWILLALLSLAVAMGIKMLGKKYLAEQHVEN